MPILRAECPSCGAVVKTTNLSVAGRTVKCPKCAKAFKLPALEEADAQEEGIKAESTIRSSRRARDDDERRSNRSVQGDDEDEMPSKKSRLQQRGRNEGADDADVDRPRRKPEKKRKTRPAAKRSKGLVIGLIAGVVFLLGGGIAAIVLLSDGHNLRGEREIRELIKAKEIADKETDSGKKTQAQLQVLAVMMTIEQMGLTPDEQSKLLQKYKTRLDELQLGMEGSWALQNKGAEEVRKKKADKENRRLSTDPVALLQALEEVDQNTDEPTCTALIKQVEDHIPIDSPKRADVIKAMGKAAAAARYDRASLKAQFVRSALRYAVKSDASALMRIRFDLYTNLAVRDMLDDLFVEWKDLAIAERIASDFSNFGVDNRRRAARILRAIGPQAERYVIPFLSPQEPYRKARSDKANSVNLRELDTVVIDLIGDIGTQKSLAVLRQFKNEAPEFQQAVEKAIEKIRQREKLP